VDKMADKAKATEIFGVYKKMRDVFAEFQIDAATQIAGHRYADEAGARSRMLSMELGSLCDQWRKASVAAHRDDDGE